MTPLHTQLDLVEQQCRQVATLLASGDAPALQSAANQLQTLCIQLPAVLAPAGAALVHRPQQRRVLRARAQQLAWQLQILREQLVRQAARNQQALEVLVPMPQRSTYAGGGAVYATVGRQSGALGVLAA